MTASLHIILDTDPALMTVGDCRRAVRPRAGSATNKSPLPATFRSKTTRNALQLRISGTPMPLASGRDAAAASVTRDAAYVHGESGMEGYDFVDHQRQPLGEACLSLSGMCWMNAPEPMTLVAIGPLTNIVLLPMHHPECACNICRLVLMGGSAGRGNFTPNAEFNIAK